MDLTSRVTALEAAVLSIATADFGAIHGHDFYGNQWTSSDGSGLGEHTNGQTSAPREIRKAFEVFKDQPSTRTRMTTFTTGKVRHSIKISNPRSTGEADTDPNRVDQMVKHVAAQGGGTIPPVVFSGTKVDVSIAPLGARQTYDKAPGLRNSMVGSTEEVELGDSPGHDFHGNQWSSGASGEGVRSADKEREARRERAAGVERRPNSQW